MRLTLFPLQIMTRKNAINMQLAKPYTTIAQEKLKKATQAKKEGLPHDPDVFENSRTEMSEAWAKNDAKMWKMALPIITQGPLFMSFFFHTSQFRC